MLFEDLQPEEPLLMKIIKQQIKKLEDENDAITLNVVSEQEMFDGEIQRYSHVGLVHDIWMKPADSMNPSITSLGFQPCSHVIVIDYFRIGKDGRIRDRATSLMRDLVMFEENNDLIKQQGRWVLTGHGR